MGYQPRARTQKGLGSRGGKGRRSWGCQKVYSYRQSSTALALAMYPKRVVGGSQPKKYTPIDIRVPRLRWLCTPQKKKVVETGVVLVKNTL